MSRNTQLPASGRWTDPDALADAAERIGRPLWAAAAVVTACGLALAVGAPEDYRQGAAVRIMFVHVPAAWMALLSYLVLFGGAVAGLAFRLRIGYVAARAVVPVGAAFTFVALITGSLWGRPVWGTWWVWDARLTSVLILFFVYLGHVALWKAIPERERADRANAVLALVGSVNLPIVKFSVEWWNTLHQPGGSSGFGSTPLHADYRRPLIVMASGFVCLLCALVVTRMQTDVWTRRVERRVREEDDDGA